MLIIWYFTAQSRFLRGARTIPALIGERHALRRFCFISKARYLRSAKGASEMIFAAWCLCLKASIFCLYFRRWVNMIARDYIAFIFWFRRLGFVWCYMMLFAGWQRKMPASWWFSLAYVSRFIYAKWNFKNRLDVMMMAAHFNRIQ